MSSLRRSVRSLLMAVALLGAATLSACAADDPTDPSELEPAGAVAPPASSPEGSAAAQTRALFDAIGDDEPGCTVAVSIDGEVTFAEAYGAARLDPLTAFDVGTVVDIASTSKQFTAIAVGLLVLDGEVDLDDAVGDVVAGLPEWGGEVTIEQLITHTSGIPDYGDLLVDAGFEDDAPAGQAEALEVLADADLDADPGEGYEYSNSNYLLLAEVVRSVDGRDLATFLGEEVFAPAGIDAELAFPAPSPVHAESYELDGEWVVADSPWTQVGDGSVRTTPSELARFGSTYWRTDGPWVDLAEIRDEVGVEGEDGTYSLGIEEIELNGRLAFSHDGAWSGFETSFLVVPDDRTTVALTCNSPDVEVADDVDQQVLAIWTA